MILSASMDLGTTLVKAAVLKEDGTLDSIRSVPAPPLIGKGLIMEGDAEAYLRTATDLLQDIVSGLPKKIPLGIASQRSTFLLWEKETGIPLTPLISWQDRRADTWCAIKLKDWQEIDNRTGLLLSSHYAGPKLAHLFSHDKGLKSKAETGSLLFGTLETFILWKWTHGQVHQTDLTMASRTLLVNPEKADWDDELLHFFEVPGIILPEIRLTHGKRLTIVDGSIITATVADQAAGLIGVMGESDELVSVNLGTGGFIVYPIGQEMKKIPGYLCGPFLKAPDELIHYALEGTINGIGNRLAGLQAETVILSKEDPMPDLFCLPDASGAGSPYWLAELPFLMSEPEEKLNRKDLKRVIMEGIIFRVSEIINDLCCTKLPAEVFLSGGLAGEEFICQGLASCLEHPVRLLKEKEATLLGAARLAIGRLSWPTPAVHTLRPGICGEYLREKFLRWKQWLHEEIGNYKQKR